MAIRLENLEVGMTLKNYKELCKVLEVEYIQGGYPRQKQMAWFNECFSYEKEGHKFLITEIYDKEVEPMKDNRGGGNSYEYVDNIERLILDILVQSPKSTIFLSKNKFFHALEMVNVNYLDTKQRVTKLSKYLKMNEGDVQEWFDTTGGVLERSLETALKNLRNQSLIIWSKEITICKVEEIPNSDFLIEKTHINKYGETVSEYITERKTRRVTREATDSEKRFILRTERNVMDFLECENKQEIIRKGLWGDFENEVKDSLMQIYNIIYYYQSYKIIFNPDHIQEKWKKANYQLDHSQRQEEKIIINSSVMDRLESNAKSRQDNANKDLNDKELLPNKVDKLERRSSNSYVHDNIKLNKTLIDRNAKDIRKEVRLIELEDNI